MTVQLAALHPERIERSAFAENSRSALEVQRSLNLFCLKGKKSDVAST